MEVFAPQNQLVATVRVGTSIIQLVFDGESSGYYLAIRRNGKGTYEYVGDDKAEALRAWQEAVRSS